MTQKKNDKSNRLLSLSLEAPIIQKKKRSLANRKKAKPFCQTTIISNVEEKFKLSRCQQNHVQAEITLEILSRLPAWSLLRFKCVSTFWKELISDPYFTKKHLYHASNDQNSHKLLTGQIFWDKDDMFRFYRSSFSSDQVFEDEKELDFPSNCKPVGSVILCSYDGLVLLRVRDTIDKQLLLWNPSTRESVAIPFPENTVKYCVFGLGYDTISGDYKILSIDLNAAEHRNVSVEILALKSGSWRKIGHYPTGIHRVVGINCGMDCLAFVHGRFHWIGRSHNRTSLSQHYTGLSENFIIVSFDISNEVYEEIPSVKGMLIDSLPVEHGAAALRGMLCVYSTYGESSGGIFHLWAMKNYGFKESWTHLLTIQSNNLFYSANPKFMFVDGEVLLRCRHKPSGCSIYRTSRGEFGYWPPPLHAAKQGIVYSESLISPRLLI